MHRADLERLFEQLDLDIAAGGIELDRCAVGQADVAIAAAAQAHGVFLFLDLQLLRVGLDGDLRRFPAFDLQVAQHFTDQDFRGQAGVDNLSAHLIPPLLSISAWLLRR